MKKNLLLTLALTCTMQGAFAQTTARSSEAVRRTVVEEMAKSKAETKVADQAQQATVTREYLSKVSSASTVELGAALNRKIKVVDRMDGANKQMIDLSLLDVGILLSTADRALRTNSPRDLDATGKAHLDASLEAIKVSSEFLSLANRTSEMRGTMTADQVREVEAFNKQISLIPDMITKMDTAEMKQHVEIMKKAITKRVNSSVTGDQAFAAAVKDGKSQEDYISKLNELISCIR